LLFLPVCSGLQAENNRAAVLSETAVRQEEYALPRDVDGQKAELALLAPAPVIAAAQEAESVT
jgi:hypothetical protein